MSDLSALMGGAPSSSQPSAESPTPTEETAGQKGKVRQVHPKPDWVKKREQVTGWTYEFDEGKRSWQPLKAGPKADQGQLDFANAFDKYTSGDYQGAYDLIRGLEKNQGIAGTEFYKRMKKKLEVQLNIS